MTELEGPDTLCKVKVFTPALPVLAALIGAMITASLGYLLGRRNGARVEQGRQRAAQLRELAAIVQEHRASLLARTDDELAGRSYNPNFASTQWAEAFAESIFAASLSLPKADQDRIFYMMKALVGPMGAQLCHDHAALPEDQRGEWTRLNWIRARLVDRELTADDLFQRGSLINALRRARDSEGENRRPALLAARAAAIEGFDNLLKVLGRR